MRGIKIKDSIELFGFKEGFKFWFRWSFIDPVETFIWLNITHRPYCLYSGWFCKNKNCEYKHLLTKKEVKARWKQHEEESKIIICGKNGECAYCGLEKGIELIDDPNMNTLKKWKVCKCCEEFIKIQTELNMLILIPTNEAKEKVFNLNNRILEIKKDSGKEFTTIGLEQNGNGGYREIEV